MLNKIVEWSLKSIKINEFGKEMLDRNPKNLTHALSVSIMYPGPGIVETTKIFSDLKLDNNKSIDFLTSTNPKTKQIYSEFDRYLFKEEVVRSCWVFATFSDIFEKDAFDKILGSLLKSFYTVTTGMILGSPTSPFPKIPIDPIKSGVGSIKSSGANTVFTTGITKVTQIFTEKESANDISLPPQGQTFSITLDLIAPEDIDEPYLERDPMENEQIKRTKPWIIKNAKNGELVLLVRTL